MKKTTGKTCGLINTIIFYVKVQPFKMPDLLVIRNSGDYYTTINNRELSSLNF